MTNRQNIKRTAELAILTAIVVVFQLLGSFIHIGPTNVSLVLVPIVIGCNSDRPEGRRFFRLCIRRDDLFCRRVRL